MELLPVFPLDVVVFPGQSVPLIVFEARYKRLVQAMLELEAPRFVIARAQRGAEGPSIAGVGTLVRVMELTERPDGTYALTGHGGERVRVQVVRREDIAEPDGSERPLFFTDAEAWPLRRDDPNQELIAAWDAIEGFRRYAATFFAAELHDVDEHVPEDPLYQASFICANLRIEGGERQLLLEAPSLIERFRRAEQLMAERVAAHRPAAEPLG